jgi:hypothetical protein
LSITFVVKFITTPAPPRDGGKGKDDDNDNKETEDDRWDGRRGRHNQKGKLSPASALVEGARGPMCKSVPLMPASSAVLSPYSPSACWRRGDEFSTVQIPACAYCQYGSNLKSTGDIFPLVAKILTSSLPSPLPQDHVVLSNSSLHHRSLWCLIPQKVPRLLDRATLHLARLQSFLMRSWAGEPSLSCV